MVSGEARTQIQTGETPGVFTTPPVKYIDNKCLYSQLGNNRLSPFKGGGNSLKSQIRDHPEKKQAQLDDNKCNPQMVLKGWLPNINNQKCSGLGTKEMTHRVRALATPVEDLGSIPGPHIVARIPGDTTGTCATHTCAQANKRSYT